MAYLVRVRYPDGCGLTAVGRARREVVRLQAVLFASNVPVAEIARRLRVSHNAVYVWRRRWLADGEVGLASKGPAGSACRLTDDQLVWLFRQRYALRGVSLLLHRIGFSPQTPKHHPGRTGRGGDHDLAAGGVPAGKIVAAERRGRGRSYASAAQGDQPVVAAVLHDLDAAPIGEPLRTTLRMLGRLTRQHTLTDGEMRKVMDAGATRQQIEDALAVCFAFNVTNRLADAFAYQQLSPKGYESGAKYLLRRGYR